MKGELAWYKKLWLERKHKCNVCGEPLPTFYVGYFSHCVSKGTRPDLALLDENLDILCTDCHQLWENKKSEIVGHILWVWLFEKYEKLKSL